MSASVKLFDKDGNETCYKLMKYNNEFYVTKCVVVPGTELDNLTQREELVIRKVEDVCKIVVDGEQLYIYILVTFQIYDYK
jgi:hypothetical protein